MSERGKCQVCSTLCESRCSLCRVVYYCSQKCQKSHWPNHKENCTRKKFKVDKNEKLGRFIVATEDVKADHILFKERPIVLGLKVGIFDVDNINCLGCYKTLSAQNFSSDEEEDDSENYSCAKCSLPICSPACSQQYFHKYFECKLFQEGVGVSSSSDDSSTIQKGTDNTENPTAVQENDGDTQTASKESHINGNGVETKKEYCNDLKETFLQHLLYFRCLLLKHVNEQHWKQLMDLQSNNEHREDIGNLERTTRLFEEMKTTLAQIRNPTIKSIAKPDLHKIIGILETNGVDIKLDTNTELIGLFTTFSMMEYSCCPTAKYYFVPPNSGKKSGTSSSKNTYELVCRSAIALKSGDHVSTVGTNILWNTSKRREELRKNKYFFCECIRCNSPTELDSNFSTILCPLSECKSPSVPIPKVGSDSGEVQWQCTNKLCRKTVEHFQVKKVDSKLSETLGKLSSKATVENYKEMLRQFELLVHPDYYLNFVVNHSVIQLQGKNDYTRNNKEVLEDKITTCNRLLGIIKKLDPGLAKLSIYQAVIYYELHTAILGLVGGEGDEDYEILRKQPETVRIGRMYLQKCIDCFQYEFIDSPETKLKSLAEKKIDYLNMLIKYS